MSGPEHELQGGLGKEREPLRVIPVSVQALPAKEISRRVRLDEEAFPAWLRNSFHDFGTL
jgi:hypothetical protein